VTNTLALQTLSSSQEEPDLFLPNIITEISINPSCIRTWLTETISVSEDERYTHHLLVEDLSQRVQTIFELRSFVRTAHEDARRHIRTLAGLSLDPLGTGSMPDPGACYPANLHLQTLKAYVGEILAAAFALSFSPLGKQGWRVPAFLFRFHDVAFHQLERLIQTGEKVCPIPGRIGNDCLAFRLDNNGHIIQCLFCEAKCTNTHDTHLIASAHEQVSDLATIPVSIYQLIAILRDRTDEAATAWVIELQRLWLNRGGPDYERCDLISYVCGKHPIKQPTWISTVTPHENYRANRRLVVVEVHLHDIDQLVDELYAE
jgi:hypothetical protein